MIERGEIIGDCCRASTGDAALNPSADLEDSALPHSLELSRYRDMRHPRPAFKGNPSVLHGRASIIGSATCFAGGAVQLATPLQRPLLEELDRVHRAADFSRSEFIVHHERWVKLVSHSFLRPAASTRPESKNSRIVEGRLWRGDEDIGTAAESFKTLSGQGQK